MVLDEKMRVDESESGVDQRELSLKFTPRRLVRFLALTSLACEISLRCLSWFALVCSVQDGNYEGLLASNVC